MFGLGMPEIVVLMLVVCLLFGAKKLPEMFRSLGEGLKEFRQASRNDHTDV